MEDIQQEREFGMTKPDVAAEACTSLGAPQRTLEPHEGRRIKLGNLDVLRALPVRERRLIGPWCFLDRFGPLTFVEGRPMDVAPHPHMGLQTVSWLLEGDIRHDDSLGSEAVLRPGGVNVMTAGRAIAHSEQTPIPNSRQLNGVQLWVALPNGERDREPKFEHLAEVPTSEEPGGIVRVFSGSLGDMHPYTSHYSPLVGADLVVHPRGVLTVPLQPEHEHGLLVLDGQCSLEGQPLQPDLLYYLGTKRMDLAIASETGGRVLLVGGAPFGETILMWWNFVARTPEEIREARDDWEAHRRFGEVHGYDGPRIPAPEVVRLARPNPVS